MRLSLRLFCLIVAICVLPLVLSGSAEANRQGQVSDIDWNATPVRLMMVEEVGCIYCARWDAEIGPSFAKSAEGQAAPLMRVEIDGPWPDGIVLAARPAVTPTFILLNSGVEQARIEGYVGKEYFYPVLTEMMQSAGIAVGKVD